VKKDGFSETTLAWRINNTQKVGLELFLQAVWNRFFGGALSNNSLLVMIYACY
jgi:hypothetical protein